MISLSGIGSFTGLTLVDATRDRQIEVLKAQPEHKRAMETFRARIADIETVDQLMEDRELYVFVMKAFDLEDQIFGKAMMSKILKSDADDPKSLVNKLTDPRFREIHEVMGFGPGGEGNSNTLSYIWQEQMVARYVDTQFLNEVAEQDPVVGAALEFRAKAGKVENAFDILKDADISRVVRAALGIPAESAYLDIDKQAEMITSRLDLETLKDPAVVEKMIRQFVAISIAQDQSAAQSNAAVQIMSGIGSGQSFAPITLDITPLSTLPARSY